MNSLRKHFQSCLDLPNVSGAFCLDSDGGLIEHFMPPPYDDQIFDELGPRVHTLLEAVESSYTSHREILIRFESHCLFIRKGESCLVGAFCAGDPVLAGLRVSINLLLKKVDPHLADGGPAGSAKAANQNNRAEDAGTTDPADTVDADDDVVIVSPSKSPGPDTPDETKRGGLFGKKSKKAKPKDIWG